MNALHFMGGFILDKVTTPLLSPVWRGNFIGYVVVSASKMDSWKMVETSSRRRFSQTHPSPAWGRDFLQWRGANLLALFMCAVEEIVFSSIIVPMCMALAYVSYTACLKCRRFLSADLLYRMMELPTSFPQSQGIQL